MAQIVTFTTLILFRIKTSKKMSSAERSLDTAIYGKLCLLLDRIKHGKVDNFAARYLERSGAIEQDPLRKGNDLMVGGKRGIVMESSLRLGSGQNNGFWKMLNTIARRNTDFIMDASVVKQTFGNLRTKAKSVTEVESAVAALVQSIGLGSLNDILQYISSPLQEIQILPDNEVLLSEKNKRLPDLCKAWPELSALNDLVKKYQDGAFGEMDDEDPGKAIIRVKNLLSNAFDRRSFIQPAIQPMSETPVPSVGWKKFSKKLQPSYNTAQIRERLAQIEAGHQEVAQIKDDATRRTREVELSKMAEALTEEMNAATRQAISYWESIVSTAMHMKTLELAYRQETELLIAGQIAEANRVVDEIIRYIDRAKEMFVSIPILIAEGHRNQGDIRQLVDGAINTCFRNITCRQEYDFHDLLTKILLLPKSQTSVVQFLIANGFPERLAEQISTMSKREQIASTIISTLYFML